MIVDDAWDDDNAEYQALQDRVDAARNRLAYGKATKDAQWVLLASGACWAFLILGLLGWIV